MSIEQPRSDRPVHWSGHPSGPLPAPGGYQSPTYPPHYPPPGYGAPGYGAPGYGYGYGAPVVPTSGVAVASLVCSLIGLLTFGLVAIAGVICGHLALPETKSGARGGHGLAVAGLIIGWIQCGGWILFWLIMLIGAAASV